MMSQLSGDADLYPGKLKSLELMKAYQEQHGLQENEPQTADGWTNMFKIPGLNLTTDARLPPTAWLRWWRLCQHESGFDCPKQEDEGHCGAWIQQ
ncbi:hypothetical protein [Cohnella faecalis]|nr:hypothetical protein [Cohnella faecalis]